MIHTAFMTFLLAVAILLQECDISSVLDLVVTFNVTVRNASSQPAFIRVGMADVTRGAFVRRGGAVSVTSFGGGRYSMIVADYDPSTNAALVKLKLDLEAQLANPGGLSPAEVKTLTDQLKTTVRELVRRNEFPGLGTGSCSGTLKAGDPPKDQNLAVTVTYGGGTWSLQGCT